MGVTAQNKGSYKKQGDYKVDAPGDAKKSERDKAEAENPETVYFAEQSASEQDPVNPAFGDPREVAEEKEKADKRAAKDRDKNYDPAHDLNPPAGVPEDVAERRREYLDKEREEAAETSHSGTVDTTDASPGDRQDLTGNAPVFEDHEAPVQDENDPNPAYGDPEKVAEAKREHDQEVAEEAGKRETGGVDPESDKNPDGKAKKFDPSEHTVPEVKEHIKRHPEDKKRVLAAEKKGQDRQGLKDL